MQQELMMEQIRKILEFIREKEIWGAVADITRLRGSFIKVLEVLRNTCYPAVEEKGHRCKAIVVSDDLITEHVATKLRDLIRDFNMNVQLFKDRIKVDGWIRKIIKILSAGGSK